MPQSIDASVRDANALIHQKQTIDNSSNDPTIALLEQAIKEAQDLRATIEGQRNANLLSEIVNLISEAKRHAADIKSGFLNDYSNTAEELIRALRS